MLTIHVPARETFDDETLTFKPYMPAMTLKLEHSLLSLSRWEEKWHEPFLGRAGRKDEHTRQQVADYIRCMCITKDVPPGYFEYLPPDVAQSINDYINDPHTATTFTEFENAGSSFSKETITAEIIYYWMLKLNIPFECEKWNLGRLLTLIRVCDVKDTPKKKMSMAELAARNRALNAQRKAQLNSNG